MIDVKPATLRNRNFAKYFTVSLFDAPILFMNPPTARILPSDKCGQR